MKSAKMRTLPWAARINLRDLCRHRRISGEHTVCLKLPFRNKLPIAAFPNKRPEDGGGGTSVRGKASRLTGRGRAGQWDSRTQAQRPPPSTGPCAPACLSFTTQISTLVSRWGILSSYKTRPYLHSLLIKKGKETPRALTTREKKNKERKKRKEKEKGKGKEKGELFELVKSKGQSLMGQKRRNEKNMESPKMVSSF